MKGELTRYKCGFYGHYQEQEEFLIKVKKNTHLQLENNIIHETEENPKDGKNE
jgi:hypothetical protein